MASLTEHKREVCGTRECPSDPLVRHSPQQCRIDRDLDGIQNQQPPNGLDTHSGKPRAGVYRSLTSGSLCAAESRLQWRCIGRENESEWVWFETDDGVSRNRLR